MGNPHYSDDGMQCFNGAKNFQLDWYEASSKVTFDPKVEGFTSETVTLVGVGEYNLRVTHPIVVRLSGVSGADYFIAFNRATGPNAQNDEADDKVTIVQVDGNFGDSYSQSFLRATLLQGQSHSMSIGGKTVTVAVNSIDIINSSPGTAVITISADGTPFPTNAQIAARSFNLGEKLARTSREL